jgi:hypothetical protein
MLNFYRRFLPHAAPIQAALHEVLSGPRVKGSRPVSWTPALHAAFDECKASLSQAALLAHPDSTAPLSLVTDASNFVMGAVLQQRVQDVWQPLAFFSRKLSPAQQKYSASLQWTASLAGRKRSLSLTSPQRQYHVPCPPFGYPASVARRQ